VEVAGFDGNRARVKQPYVVDELCNGCGICENVCPLEGKSAIVVLALKDRMPLRPPTETAPAPVSDPCGRGKT